jgi:hypothetical protein
MHLFLRATMGSTSRVIRSSPRSTTAMNRNRREFLADVGKGMLIASVGPGLAADLGLSSAWAEEGPQRLLFGDHEPLVALMQDTPADKLLPILVDKLKAGTELKILVAAAALANARTYGGEDYKGFHNFMALMPSHQMASELPKERQPLPVLKVLYRNTRHMQEFGGREKEVLHPVAPATLPKGRQGGEVLREATRAENKDRAERILAALAKGSAGEMFNQLQMSIQDEVDVHRIVLPWRAWVMLELTGKEHALTLLRQSVRHCIDQQVEIRQDRPESEIRKLLPRLLDQYRLLGGPVGKRRAEDGWVERLTDTLCRSDGPRSADAVAAALAEGISPEDVGEAISLAANAVLLCDPAGSVHGASSGVHQSDAVNGWRNVARVSSPRHAVASLILAAYYKLGAAAATKRHPLPEQLEKIKAKDSATLLRDADAAIRDKDQSRSCALVHRYGELGHPPGPVFGLLLKYAVSEDGSLHAEKYYRAVVEEFAATRAAFRWRHLVALARVTASAYGSAAPGYAEACRLLNV